MLRRKSSAGSTAVEHPTERDSVSEPRQDSVDVAKERRADRPPHQGARPETVGTTGTAERVGTGTGAAHRGHVEARDRFGGVNWGAGFFGWLVAIGLALLLTGSIGALAAAIGSSLRVSQSAAEREAGTIGVAAAVTLLVVLAVASFVGGYVAGRMSRFDGGKQGLATWVIGLLVTLLAVGLGAVFGNEYNVLDRIDLPNIALTGEQLSWGAALTGLAAVVLTLLAAMLGGKVGHRYHDKVDRVAHR